ncbi:SLAM family member 9-like [Acomys russatus]|uniref:SLAM family member 9-like n=1 Tax=Acomys russatus TaxID=60746 RepID=UPI0021E29C5B|nr:SLAM family member 9-like [Acomys russatus]
MNRSPVCTTRDPVSLNNRERLHKDFEQYGPEASRVAPESWVVTGTLGESVTLPLQLPSGQQVDSISWTSRSEPRTFASITAVETGELGTFYEAKTRYWGRVSIVHPDFSLQISNLSLEDAGPYRAYINLRHSPITHTRKYHLQVWERLKKLSITASSQITRDRTCMLTLVCSLEQAGVDVQYHWEPHGQGAIVSSGGSTHNVSWTSGDSDSYHCTAKNPVSQSASSVPVGLFCLGNAFVLCFCYFWASLVPLSLAFFLDLEEAEVKWGHGFAAECNLWNDIPGPSSVLLCQLQICHVSTCPDSAGLLLALETW